MESKLVERDGGVKSEDESAAAGFETSMGYMLGRARLELSAVRRKSNLDEKFSGISHLDETPIWDSGNDLPSDSSMLASTTT